MKQLLTSILCLTLATNVQAGSFTVYTGSNSEGLQSFSDQPSAMTHTVYEINYYQPSPEAIEAAQVASEHAEAINAHLQDIHKFYKTNERSLQQANLQLAVAKKQLIKLQQQVANQKESIKDTGQTHSLFIQPDSSKNSTVQLNIETNSAKNEQLVTLNNLEKAVIKQQDLVNKLEQHQASQKNNIDNYLRDYYLSR